MDTIVSQMLETVSRNREEISNLEEIFNENCKCQSVHKQSKCTFEVTHHVHSQCGVYPHKVVCLGAATVSIWHMKAGIAACAGCGVLARDCWIIRPI